MSQEQEENRKAWPGGANSFTIGSNTVNGQKVWEPDPAYSQGGEYGKVQVTTYRGGQSVEIDSTEGGERIKVSHPSGSYTEMQPNGDAVKRTNGDDFEVVAGEKNLRAQGDYSISIDGDKNEKIGGDSSSEVASLTIYSVGPIKLVTPHLDIIGASVTHNGVNIGDTHKHTGVMPGGGTSGVPVGGGGSEGGTSAQSGGSGGGSEPEGSPGATQEYVDGKVANVVSSSLTNYYNETEVNNLLNDLLSGVDSDIGTKLDTSLYTAADVLSKLLSVDGASSGIDSDLLDGQQGVYYASNTYVQATFTPLATTTTDNAIARYNGTSGLLQNSSVVIDDNGDVTITFVDATAVVGPSVNLYRDSSSPAISDILAKINFLGRDSANNIQNYGGVRAVINDPTSASEDSSLIFSLPVAGADTDRLTLSSTGATVTGQLRGPGGSIASPGITVGNDTDSGLWSISDNSIGIAIGGANNIIRFLSSGVNIKNDTNGTDTTVWGTDQAIKLIHNTGGAQIDVTNGTGGGALRLSRGIASDGQLASFARTTVQTGSISVTASATAFNTSSDYRLKFDVIPLVEMDLETLASLVGLVHDAPNLLRVMAYRPVSHKWLADPDSPAIHGFIAHEVQEITPNAVTGYKDEIEDFGTAVIPAKLRNGVIIVPEEVIENILEREAPVESTWTKTGERPVYQGIDTGFLLADLTASVQELTLLVLAQGRMIEELKAQLLANQ